MENFLQRLARNPYAPIDGASVTSVDELGNGYDDWGQIIAPKFEQPQQTWGETALGIATAPARIATSLVGSLSPYGQDGWQVPPAAQEGWNALTAVGDAYTQGMSEDEINSRALGMAGFMMGGGGAAMALEKSLAQRGINSTADMIPTAVKDYGQAAYRSIRYPGEEAAMASLPNDVANILRRNRTDVKNPTSPQYSAYVSANFLDPNFKAGNELDAIAPSQTGYMNALIRKDADQYKPTLQAMDGGKSIRGQAQPFFSSGFKPDDSASVTATGAYEHYVGWADRNGIPVMDFPTFNRAMSEEGFNRQRLAGALRYTGVELNDLYSNASKEGAIPAIVAGQEAKPVTAYRGVRHGDMHGPINANNQYWMTDRPELASAYAMDENLPYQAPAVLPVNPDFKNPLTVDAAFSPWDKVPFEGGTMNTNAIAETAAGRGYDGVVFNNVIDAPSDLNPWSKPSSVYAAIKPNTVRSATTGETLFSNADSKPALLASGLDMGQEARLARARDMGFDTDRVLYHGTRNDFDEFMKPQKYSQYGPGVYMAEDPEIASHYAMLNNNVDDSRVLPLYAKKGKYATGEQVYGLAGELARAGKATRRSDALELAVQQFKDEGYVGTQANGYTSIFDPRNIRSVNAAFDPAKSDSANLLAANADSRPALLGAGQEQDIPDWLLPYLR